MSTPLEERILTAAQAFPALITSLASNPFGMYFTTLPQGAAFPCIVMRQISGARMYRVDARMKTGFQRVSFTIWGGQFRAGFDACVTVKTALLSFMDNSAFDGIAVGSTRNQAANYLLLDLSAEYFQTDSPIYQRILDFNIYDDNTL